MEKPDPLASTIGSSCEAGTPAPFQGKARLPFLRFVPAWLQNAWGLTGLFLAVYVLLFALWTVFHPGGEENAPLISDIAYLPVSLFGAVCAWRIAGQQVHELRLRRAWLALGFGLFSTFLADAIWFYYEIILQQSPFPSAADIFYLTYYPLMLAGLVLLPSLPRRRSDRFKFGLDLTIVLVAAWLPVWYFLIVPAVAGSEGDLFSRILAAAYPVADLILIAGLVLILLRRPGRGTVSALALVLGGLAFSLAGDLLYGYQGLAGTYISGSWVDSTWIIGYLFWALAALRTMHREDGEVAARTHRTLERVSALLPFISSGLAYLFVVAVTAINLLREAPVEGLLVGAALLAGLIMARQLVELRDNQRLNADLQKTSEQLRQMSNDFEQRAIEREADVALAAKVGQRLSRLSDLDALLTDAVVLIQERFNLYHTQVYLVDVSLRMLVLRAGTGRVGAELLRREHQLPVNLASINGTAVAEKRPVIVSDTTRSLIFRPNPLLPETRSEMAVPLLVDDQVVGVLDMQSAQLGIFTSDRLPAFEAVAGRLAIAIENARLFSEVARAREEVAFQVQRLARAGWQDTLDAIERSEHIGYQYQAGVVAPLAEPLDQAVPPEGIVEVPILISGVSVGKFRLEPGEAWKGADLELANAIARGVAQQAENLRQQAQADRFRMEAEKAVRRLTRQGWDEFFDRIDAQEAGYVYDGTAVTPWEPGHSRGLSPSVRTNLEVHGETIGELAAVGVEALDEQASQILTAVNGQLSAHIENLRLYASAQQELSERRRAEENLLKFRLGLERATEAIFITDTQGVILYTNPAFEKVYGYSQAEALGQTPRILKSGVIPAEGYQEFWKTLLNRQVVAGEIVNKTRDGRLIPIEGANNPIVDENGELIGFLAVHRDISERKQAEEALTKRAAELETVAQLSAAVTVISDPLQVMQAVVDLTKEAFGLYHAHIYELDPSGRRLVLAAGAGPVGRQMVAQGWEIPLDRKQSLVARAARTRQGVIINEVRAEPDFMPNPLLPETRAEMAIPILAGEAVLGVLDVQADTTDRFTPEDIHIQTTLAAQVAVALENARLFQRTQAALAETEALYAISTAAARTLDLDEILKQTLEQLLAVLKYSAGLVSMADVTSGRLSLSVHTRLPEPLVTQLAEKGLDGTLCDQVYRQGAAISIEDLEQDAPVDTRGLVRLGLRSYLGVPIESRGRTLGTICIFGSSPRQIQPSEWTLLQAAAQQVGIAIENARLFQQVQRQAEHEALINTISQKIQSTTTVENALQVAIRELGQALGAQRTSVQLSAARNRPTLAPARPGSVRSNGM